jgi:hypothetical protein
MSSSIMSSSTQPGEDNTLLAQAAALAGATVAIIKHSGRRGTYKEFDALVAGLEEAARRYPANPLVQALLTPATRNQIAGFAREYADVPKKTTVQDFKMAALNRCAQAADWLDQHAVPAQAVEVKQCILTVCRQVAAESSEGGFLGFGGVQVDALEEGVILEIARALRAG